MDIIKRIIRRPRKAMALGAFSMFGLGFGPLLQQCAPPPKHCEQYPSSQECTPPYVVVSPSGQSANAYAGTQFLKDINQTLLRVDLLCAGASTWSNGGWTNADAVSGPITSAYWSCYPRQIAAASYTTQHS